MLPLGRQLEWVQRNRAAGYRPARLDEVVDRYAQQVEPVDTELISAAEGVVAEVIDPRWRGHCRVTGARHGVLTVHVDSPGLLYVLRQRFAAEIERKLGRSRRTGELRRVDFRWGPEGFPPPRQSRE